MKKNRRSRQKYPALKPEYNLKSRYELIDYDYVNQLSEEEKTWLNNFTEEYVNANFKHEGKRIHPKKILTKVVNAKKKAKKRTKKIDYYKSESERRNNARNACVLTKAKASGKAIGFEELENGLDNLDDAQNYTSEKRNNTNSFKK